MYKLKVLRRITDSKVNKMYNLHKKMPTIYIIWYKLTKWISCAKLKEHSAYKLWLNAQKLWFLDTGTNYFEEKILKGEKL